MEREREVDVVIKENVWRKMLLFVDVGLYYCRLWVVGCVYGVVCRCCGCFGWNLIDN